MKYSAFPCEKQKNSHFHVKFLSRKIHLEYPRQMEVEKLFYYLLSV